MRLLIRHPAACVIAALICMAIGAPASAQWLTRRPAAAAPDASASAQPYAPEADVHGVVLDERGQPLPGVVLSALGSTTVFAVSGQDGRFSFRSVPFGPYLLRAHLQGYLPPRAQLIQVNRTPLTIDRIALTRRGEGEEAVPVLAAGVAGGDTPTATAGETRDTHDHGEVAWRLRHLKRSILKDAAVGAIDREDDGAFGESWSALGRAVGAPARVASSLALFAELPWDGQIDFLTSTSFERPQDLWSMPSWPRGVAFVALEAPTAAGRWTMRGAVTQGDLSSWIVAGSYRRAPAAHRYEAGLSYGVQRSLADTADAGRNVGAMYAYDDWTLNPRLAVRYGAKYARYDYLPQRSLFSPRFDVTVMPAGTPAFKLTAGVSRRAIAPGAEEFLPPPGSGLWLPPERTFSSVSPRRGFLPELIEHAEVGAEREWGGSFVVAVRAFRERVDDQLVTLFDVALPGAAAAPLGHYYVASAGNVDARGWGVRMSRTFARAHASVDYVSVDARWLGPSPDAPALLLIDVPVRRENTERFHDLTTAVEGSLPLTETRLTAIVKVNSRLADTSGGAPRFNVQVNQALPFVKLGGAHWEMIVAVRSLFRADLGDASVYDEALVVRPPKRVIGGVTVRF